MREDFDKFVRWIFHAVPRSRWNEYSLEHNAMIGSFKLIHESENGTRKYEFKEQSVTAVVGGISGSENLHFMNKHISDTMELVLRKKSVEPDVSANLKYEVFPEIIFFDLDQIDLFVGMVENAKTYEEVRKYVDPRYVCTVWKNKFFSNGNDPGEFIYFCHGELGVTKEIQERQFLGIAIVLDHKDGNKNFCIYRCRDLKTFFLDIVDGKDEFRFTFQGNYVLEASITKNFKGTE